MTDSKASMLMRWKMASRRMPALLTTPSSLPKLSIAALTMLARRDGLGHGLEIGHRRAAALPDFLDHLLGRRGARAGAIGGDAGIVDDDLGAFGRAQQRDLAPDAASRAGDDDDSP